MNKTLPTFPYRRLLITATTCALMALMVLPTALADTRGLDVEEGTWWRATPPPAKRMAKTSMTSGTLRYSAASGLTLDATPLRIIKRTTFYPLSDLSSTELWQLDGRQATVLGTRTGRGVQAEVVIVQPKDGFSSQIRRSAESNQYLVPNPENPEVGEMKANAPQ